MSASSLDLDPPQRLAILDELDKELGISEQHDPPAADAAFDGRSSSEAPRASGALDGNTPISYMYLTFATELPPPPRRGQVGPGSPSTAELPPCPDLRPFASPVEWSRGRKSVILVLSCISTFLTAYTAGSFSPPSPLMAKSFGVSHEAVLVGITTFCMGFALAPMLLAPLSEIWGRKPIFVAAGVVFVLFQALCSVMPDVGGMLVCRFFTGAGASVFSTCVGGVLADVYDNHERNTPMSLYSGAVLAGTGAGPLVSAALIETLGERALAWKWTFWVQVILDAALLISLILFFTESRRPVILSRKARALNRWYEELERHGVYGVWTSRKAGASASTSTSVSSVLQLPATDVEKPTGSASDAELRRIRWIVKEDENRASLLIIITTSLKRPFHLLVTEPVIFCFSIWAAFSWGVLYLSFSIVPFLYGFDFSMNCRPYVAMIIASCAATTVGICQDKLLKHPQWRRHEDGFQYSDSRFWAVMRKRFPAEAPESRLYFSCITAMLLPAGLFLAFMSNTQSHSYLQAVGLGLALWGIYSVYLATFNYFADAYHIYASSALAAQSFCRNVLGGVFPLVTTAMFTNLGIKGAGGVLGGIATVLTVIPWVLIFFGEKIRSKSRVAVSMQKTSI